MSRFPLQSHHFRSQLYFPCWRGTAINGTLLVQLRESGLHLAPVLRLRLQRGPHHGCGDPPPPFPSPGARERQRRSGPTRGAAAARAPHPCPAPCGASKSATATVTSSLSRSRFTAMDSSLCAAWLGPEPRMACAADRAARRPTARPSPRSAARPRPAASPGALLASPARGAPRRRPQRARHGQAPGPDPAGAHRPAGGRARLDLPARRNDALHLLRRCRPACGCC